MKRLTTRAALVVVVSGLLASLGFVAFFMTAAWGSTAGANPGATFGIDGDISGNTASDIPSVEDCANGDIGQQFYVDLYVQDVTNLIAFETCIIYDPEVVSIVGAEVDGWFLDGPESNVQNYSGPTTYSNVYRVQAADIGGPPDPIHSGSGVLARLTLEGLSGGIGPAKPIPPSFLTWCPLALTDIDGNPIYPSVSAAHIGVDRPDLCSQTVDTDEDGTVNLLDADDDDDAFDDNREAYMGTDPLCDCSAVRTTLSLPANPGDSSITVISATGFSVGDWITINPQQANQEVQNIAAIAGSVISLAGTIRNAHSVGELLFTDTPDHAAWPPDMENDSWVTVLDLQRMLPHMFSAIGWARYDRRYDLDTDLSITVLDIMKLRPYMFTGCVNR